MEYLTSEQAIAMLNAAKHAAAIPSSILVTNPGGSLRSFIRQDGAPLGTIATSFVGGVVQYCSSSLQQLH
jgi:uncharacterized protein GlcG (DUF336 family)